MGGNSGGGGKPGRGGGGGSTNGDAGQPGEVVREANLANEVSRLTLERNVAQDRFREVASNRAHPDYKKLYSEHRRTEAALDDAKGKLRAAQRAKESQATIDARNSRNLESSRQNDIMEGGKSFRNPSVYKSNAPPTYKPKK